MGVGVQLQGPGYAAPVGAPKPDALAITVALSPGQDGCFSLSESLRCALALGNFIVLAFDHT